MTPASPDPTGREEHAAPPVEPVDLRPPELAEVSPDARAQIELVLAPVEAAVTDLDQLRADNAVQLEQESRRGLDPEIERTLHQAAKNPDAPESLRRIAHQVSLGQMSWGDVFGPGARTDDPDVADLRQEAFATARARADTWQVEVVPIDPDGPPPPTHRGSWIG